MKYHRLIHKNKYIENQEVSKFNLKNNDSIIIFIKVQIIIFNSNESFE